MRFKAKKKKLLSRLRQDARKVARSFRIKYKVILEEVDTKHLGSCEKNGHITIRLMGLKTNVLMSYKNLQRTLCHELAHAALSHDWAHAHNKVHKAIEDALFVWLRRRR